jgi:hypothetical protein
MYSQDTTGGILRQLKNGAPQARYVEITLMESYDKKVGFLLA